MQIRCATTTTTPHGGGGGSGAAHLHGVVAAQAGFDEVPMRAFQRLGLTVFCPVWQNGTRVFEEFGSFAGLLHTGGIRIPLRTTD
ncbi:hypothetical protein OAN307_c17340 [Octadecabacter antarcticus 307]|uniref:Uncharacterized protein n=1 Tax=Octadecabacter antarcticus 307 TaxID=391626 RepID=M9R442_9RHOB|nr:hypothetical protein OAN307_c17340 [Octadecabacter antarcticus 307]